MRKKKRKNVPYRRWVHSMESSELYLRCELDGRWQDIGVKTVKTASGHTAVRHSDLENMAADEHAAWIKALDRHWHSKKDNVESLLIIGDRKV